MIPPAIAIGSIQGLSAALILATFILLCHVLTPCFLDNCADDRDIYKCQRNNEEKRVNAVEYAAMTG